MADTGQPAVEASPPFPPPPPVAPITLLCLSGPDQGKRLTVGAEEVTLGRSPDCGLLSDDPDVGPDYAGFLVYNGQLHFRARAASPLYLDGVSLQMGTLPPGGQLRIGRSYWQAEGQTTRPDAPRQAASSLFDRLGQRVGAMTGVGNLEGFRAQEMFSSLRDKHSEEEIEEYFITGTRMTTPALAEIQAVWPKPWVFFKVFLALIAVYAACAFGVTRFGNEKLLPTLMVIGSFAVPISVLLFYFEMNVPRNVSIYQVFKMVLVGGSLSLIVTLFGYDWFKAFSFLGGFLPGIIEETGKVAALWLVVNNRRYPWTLNGLLLGGAVGVGFAGFESAGYAFDTFLGALQQGDGQGGVSIESVATAVSSSVFMRGVLSPGGHVAWCALNGAALWKVKGDRPFSWDMLQDSRFLRVFLLTVVLHGLWDLGISPTFQSIPSIVFLGLNGVLTVVALTAVLGFVQDGIKQVQSAQVAATASAPVSEVPL